MALAGQDICFHGLMGHRSPCHGEGDVTVVLLVTTRFFMPMLDDGVCGVTYGILTDSEEWMPDCSFGG